MYCRRCGKEVSDEAVVCIHCGCTIDEGKMNRVKASSAEMDTPKTGIGILLGWFLNIIGLIIGLCMYPEGTVARKTFLKAWGITFAINIVLSIALAVGYYLFFVEMLEDLMSSFPTA